MSDTPVILLDFDGVVNAHGPYADRYHKSKRRFNPHWDCKMSTGTARSQGRDWTIWWAQPLVDRLAKLHTSGLAEVRWCSTWNSDAGQLEDLVGLPCLGVAFQSLGRKHWEIPPLKRAAAWRVLHQERRRLVWLDDNEVPFTWELAWAEMTRDDRALLVRPKEALGLLPAHLDQIEQYVGAAADVA